MSLSENSVVGCESEPFFFSGKDSEVRQRRIGSIVDTAPDVHRDSQAEKGPLEARSSSPTDSYRLPT